MCLIPPLFKDDNVRESMDANLSHGCPWMSQA
ncbi:hypothetical protein T12_6668 [Trichinella patagoniensis]|uniref:Uncharacterized protein n=1 Tax=Trichinella patagoniensis TaxID=990121 RepID=A0A0V0W0U8_9BILA|nr:hypothetical protein T12_6668 [Trichinella patagoniensis]